MYARQAITTRFSGPTNHRGARVFARCDAGRLTHVWDDGLSSAENHGEAARALALKVGWTKQEAHLGATKDGYVVVFIDRHQDGTQVLPKPDL